MRHALQALKFLALAGCVGLALAFLLLLAQPQWAAALQQRVIAAPNAPAATVWSGPVSYADAVKRAAPSVVSIYTARVVTELLPLPLNNPALQRFSGITLGQPRRRLERALGSGVIVSEDGYVLTNHHVIARADEIQIVFWTGQATQARIVGSDPETDLAVLKVEGSELPAMSLQAEAPVAVGDVVLAIGNPFGLRQTVTQGIVSGLGRSPLNVSGFEDFIQTDAAINEGNSGGALISARGELVGINTFVLGRRAGAEGIGFAIPLSLARQVLTQIIEHGVVVRGWLGAEYGDAPVLPGALAPGTPRGIAISTVYPGGPADAAGLRPGDVLTEFNGEVIVDQGDLREREAALPPGSVVPVAGYRAGVPLSGSLTLAQRPLVRSG
jgi:serine peptidase DegS